MRLTLRSRCKFLWDTSALEYDESLHGVEQLAIGDNVASKNVLYHPLKFDATVRPHSESSSRILTCSQTLREIAGAFGPLEHFAPYEAVTEDGGRFCDQMTFP